MNKLELLNNGDIVPWYGHMVCIEMVCSAWHVYVFLVNYNTETCDRYICVLS